MILWFLSHQGERNDKKEKETKKAPPQGDAFFIPRAQSPKNKSFLSAFLSHKISPTKSSQHSDTAAKRNSVLVVLLIVVGQTGGKHPTVTVIARAVEFLVIDHRTAFEETATIGVGESRHAKSKNDCQD